MTAVATPSTRPEPTIWGCTPHQLHDRFWAAFGIQVVRRNEPCVLVEGAEAFLLCEPGTLVLFRAAEVIDTLYWVAPELLVLRVRDSRPSPYHERAVTDAGQLVRFERVYRDRSIRSARVALTPDRSLALAWQNAPQTTSPWRWLRARVAPDRVAVRALDARTYDDGDPQQVMTCLRDVMRFWGSPDATVPRARRARAASVWADTTAQVARDAQCVGPVWIGAGRKLDASTHVVGPAVLWDDPAIDVSADQVDLREIEPTALLAGDRPPVTPSRLLGKRAFDIVFALIAILITAPLYPIVMLAILLEDGWPFFFSHRRETVGGEEFGCIKFRSMRKDADEIKAQLAEQNQSDGPQFFMKDDPRISRVGRFIRKTQIDEIPQFFNVLLGDMSVVGPRPSPFKENQYCPAWREARLSVRPGVTGLWQVSRTRQEGLDFQEWIRFDLEYVERATWWLDLQIIVKTIRIVLRGLR